MVSKPPHDDIPISKIQEKITIPIVERFDPVRVILFGSRARGNMKHDSDIDIAVILDDDDTTFDRQKLKAEALNVIESDTGVGVDVCISIPNDMESYKGDADYDEYYVMRDGVVLYERRTG